MEIHFTLKMATTKGDWGTCRGDGVNSYRREDGSVMYVMIGMRPDLAFAVGLVCRYMSNLIKEH